MNKTERELVATYLENHDTEYILQNYNEIAKFLTTPDLKNNFLAAVQELNSLSQDNRENIEQSPDLPQNSQIEMPEGYSINEFGEIIRPDKNIELQKTEKQIDNQISLKQKVAQFLQKHNLFMNMSLVDKFVHKQLDVLPAPTQEIRTNNRTTNITTNRNRNDFINSLRDFNTDIKLQPVQRMSDPQKIEEMRRKMSQNDMER